MFPEDLSVFFNPAEFAQPAWLAGARVTGLFDNAYASADAGPFGMASTAPAFTLTSAQVPANVVGSVLTVGAEEFGPESVQYTVVEHQSDGTGVSTLYLQKATA